MQSWEFGGLAKQVCDGVAKAEFTAADTNVAYIANFDGRIYLLLLSTLSTPSIFIRRVITP